MSERKDIGWFLDLNDEVRDLGSGFTLAYSIHEVKPTLGRPFGLKYSLTLHKDGRRVVCYDNAHVPQIGSGPSAKSRRKGMAFDHRHYKGRRVAAYEFKDCVTLFEDFWHDVRTVMDEEGSE